MMRTRREMGLTMKIAEYRVDQVILYLGSYTNFLPKHTWEYMGRSTS